MIQFKTASGSVYEITDVPSGRWIRRVNQSAEKRADGVWIRLIINPSLEVGSPAFLILDSLSRYGGDDFGTDLTDASPCTYRRTTEIVEVKHVA